MKLKRLIAGVTAAALTAAAFAVTAFAAAPSTIQLGGNHISGGYNSGGVSYDDSTATLTLDDVYVNTYQYGYTSYSALYLSANSSSDLNIELSGNNYFGDSDGMYTGIETNNTNITFTGSGSLEISAVFRALYSDECTETYTFKPDDGYTMTIYGGSSTDSYTELAQATSDSPFTIRSTDTAYFNSYGDFNYNCLKIETTTPYEKKVTGEYKTFKPAEVYSVDIEWGSMSFTYNEPQKVWDTKKLKYVSGKGTWSCDEGANAITVTNHSNAPIIADVGFYASENHSDIDYEITSDPEGNNLQYYLELPTAEGYNDGTNDIAAGGRRGTLYFHIKSGELTAGAENNELGNIKIILYDENWGEI